MTDLTFTIAFHGPFHVATGEAVRGADLAVDHRNPLPASSLKGVMRWAATHTLGLPRAVVDDVFGTARRPSPWSWGTPVFTTPVEVGTRTRLAVSPTGSAITGAKVDTDECWADTATFDIVALPPAVAVAPEAGTSGAAGRTQQAVVLTAAAHAVTSLGSDRRRGYGWVTITRTGDHDGMTGADHAVLDQLLEDAP